VAALLLKHKNISVSAYVSKVGSIQLNKNHEELDLAKVDSNVVRCPDERVASQMIEFIEKVKKNGDTVGGLVTCVIKNVPAGLGEPVFDKLHAQLAYAMMGINAVKGFEYGSGFQGATLLGSQHNDEFYNENGTISTKTNFSGGIQGGISNGQDIYFNVAFKPVATIMQLQKSVNNKGEEVEVGGRGRHDPCVLPRAVPIVEAMANLVIADNLLLARNSRL
jgi:chorismate synthase